MEGDELMLIDDCKVASWNSLMGNEFQISNFKFG